MAVLCEILRQGVLSAVFSINASSTEPPKDVCYGVAVTAMSQSSVGSTTSFRLNANGVTTQLGTLERLPDGTNGNGVATFMFKRTMTDPKEPSGNTGIVKSHVDRMAEGIKAFTTPLPAQKR